MTCSARLRPAPARPRRSRCRSCSLLDTHSGRSHRQGARAGARPASSRCRSARRCSTTGAISASRSCRSIGGQPIDRQLQQLDRGVHVVVATPGRAIDHIGAGRCDSTHAQTVVLDEADEMLDMGFTDDIEAILERTPDDRQTVLFSATMPPRINSIAKRYQRDPVRIQIGKGEHQSGEAAHPPDRAYFVQRAAQGRRARPDPRHRVAARRRSCSAAPATRSTSSP